MENGGSQVYFTITYIFNQVNNCNQIQFKMFWFTWLKPNKTPNNHRLLGAYKLLMRGILVLTV